MLKCINIPLFHHYAINLVVHVFIAAVVLHLLYYGVIYGSRIACVVLCIHLRQSYCIEAELTNSAYEPAFPLRLFCNHSITTQQSMIAYCCRFFLIMSDPQTGDRPFRNNSY